jgi:histidinol-phosphatase (PHP family)
MFDSHMHTPLCQHAEGSPLEYAQAALERGLQGICVTDHNPMPAWFDANFRMRESELPQYLEMVAEAREAMAGKLEVRVGLEADFHPGTEQSVQKMLEAHDWDYVIGSVHFIGAWGFDNPAFVAEYDRRDLEAVYAEYYKLIVAAAQSGLFDAIGHLDLPKKLQHRWLSQTNCRGVPKPEHFKRRPRARHSRRDRFGRAPTFRGRLEL